MLGNYQAVLEKLKVLQSFYRFRKPLLSIFSNFLRLMFCILYDTD